MNDDTCLRMGTDRIYVHGMVSAGRPSPGAPPPGPSDKHGMGYGHGRGASRSPRKRIAFPAGCSNPTIGTAAECRASTMLWQRPGSPAAAHRPRHQPAGACGRRGGCTYATPALPKSEHGSKRGGWPKQRSAKGWLARSSKKWPKPERRHEMAERIEELSTLNGATKWPKSEHGSEWPNAERPKAENEQRHSRLLALSQPGAL